ncbi:MAG: stage III sporulation protein AB [Agathobacter sp.]|nr:stage III sporulation protein AB [Agathobacter sp.]
MGKIVGIVLVLGGIAGGLCQWMELQKVRQKRIEEFCLFLHKSIFMMESEKIKVIDYFAKTITKDSEITGALQEISRRLSKNIYPNPQFVWEEVLNEKKWDLDKEEFSIILKSGNGFFGRNREENICFLKKQLEELEKQQIKRKEKDAKERKVWVPVSMLSGMMLVILFL